MLGLHSLSFIYLNFIGFTASDVVLSAVFLLDPSNFSPPVYESVIKSLLGGSKTATVTSVQPDILTGLEAKQHYFPNDISIYTFQLIHITRVMTSISCSVDELIVPNSSFSISLPMECARAGMGLMAIDSVTNADTSTVWKNFVNWLVTLPPFLAPLAIGLWILSMISCGVCWLVYCCCKNRREPEAPIGQAATVLNAPETLDALQRSADLDLSLHAKAPVVPAAPLIINLPPEWVL